METLLKKQTKARQLQISRCHRDGAHGRLYFRTNDLPIHALKLSTGRSPTERRITVSIRSLENVIELAATLLATVFMYRYCIL